jgi:hypothetical protein
MLLISVFFVSLSTLAFEVLLTRVFSIGQWNHLSFMVISIALFGFGASGTFLSIIDIRKKAWMQQIQSRIGLTNLLYLYSASTILSFLALNHLPLDYFRLPVEPSQIFYLLAAYLLLALPFFFSGMLISMAYITVPEKTGLVYFVSMSGSALGAVLPIPLLPLLGEGKLIIISALISLIPAIFTTPYPHFKNIAEMRRMLGTAVSFTFIFFAIFILGPAGRNLTHVKPSPYKALSQVMQFPKTHIVETKTSIRGRIDRIKTPYIRYAPGLSLKYTAALPGQDAVFKDGDNQLVLYDMEHNPAELRFAKYLLSYAAYNLKRHPQSVLLIVAGGGSSIPCAAASGAGQISIVVQSPQVAGILSRQYRHNIINQNPRVFLAQDDYDYDIIHIENWGTSIPGTAALNQEHFFTIEAFAEYWNHLTPDGVIIISRKLLLPPSDSLRLWSAAYEALARIGIKQPEGHLAMLRNFDTFTLIVSKSMIDFQRTTEFAGRRNFDLVFLQGMDRAMVNRFNVFDKPYHFEEINRLAKMYRAGRQNDFFRHYLLDVAPQSDMRPFPGRFLKWSKVKTLYRSMGSRLYALFLSGEIVVSVVFVEALFIALILLFIPLFVSTRGTRKPALSQVIYFFAVGAGFMLLEIYFIKRFIILVGDPVISFTVVIAGILFFSGLGGIWVHKKPQHNLRLPLAVLITVLVLETVVFELLISDILKASTGMQYVSIFLFLLPAGFLMGLPFPLGMRYLLDTPVQRAYAWSVNGCASVLTAIVAAQVAISWGIPQVAAAGMLAYVVAVFAVGKGIGNRRMAHGIRNRRTAHGARRKV